VKRDRTGRYPVGTSDLNIIIYSTQPQHQGLRDFIRKNAPAVSGISYLEVLGFHRLTDAERQPLEQFFARAEMLDVDRPVLDNAVALRQQRKMSLGDAIIAATSLLHDRVLVTRNADDFKWVPGLQLLNPFDSTP
jgi:predicted nucleic acid-binding protein